MRLTLRISLWLAAAAALVLLALELVVIAREGALLEQEHARETLLVAERLASVLAHAEVEDPAVLLATPAEHGGLGFAWRPLAALGDARGPLSQGQALTLHEAGGVRSLAPVGRGEALRGAVEVWHTRAGRDAFIGRSLTTALVAIVVITGLAGGLALVLGQRFVGRRVERLVEKTRQVARGDLQQPVLVEGGDELGVLARALEDMSADLLALRRVAASEARARLEAERALLHADRLRTLGLLSAGVAHELGTPLNVISGRSRLIERRADDPKVVEDAATIREQVTRISHIVRLMMAFARGTAPDAREVDLARLVVDARDLLSAAAREAGVALELDLPPEGVTLRADPEQLTQLLTNLCLNAMQASPPGGRVRVVARAGPRAAELAVEDEGPGVPPELRERVFEPFFTTKPPGEGTGLGLSIVRRVALDHGGALRVESAPGGGARFVVTLPLGGPP